MEPEDVLAEEPHPQAKGCTCMARLDKSLLPFSVRTKKKALPASRKGLFL
jgi:hypothetical protein